MTVLGPCTHRYGFDRHCAIVVMDTPNGPGHVSRPVVPHYPVTRKTTAPASSRQTPETGAMAAAGTRANRSLLSRPPVARARRAVPRS